MPRIKLLPDENGEDRISLCDEHHEWSTLRNGAHPLGIVSMDGIEITIHICRLPYSNAQVVVVANFVGKGIVISKRTIQRPRYPETMSRTSERIEDAINFCIMECFM